MDVKVRIEAAKAKLEDAKVKKTQAETKLEEAEKQLTKLEADMKDQGVTPTNILEEITKLEAMINDNLDKIEKNMPQV